MTDAGREQATRTAAGRSPSAADSRPDPLVFTSPLRPGRARRRRSHCRRSPAEETHLLIELDYGEYDGLTADEIRSRVPGLEPVHRRRARRREPACGDGALRFVHRQAGADGCRPHRRRVHPRTLQPDPRDAPPRVARRRSGRVPQRDRIDRSTRPSPRSARAHRLEHRLGMTPSPGRGTRAGRGVRTGSSRRPPPADATPIAHGRAAISRSR